MPLYRPPLATPAGCTSALVRGLTIDGLFTPLALPGIRGWFHPGRGAKTDGAIALLNASNQYLSISDHADWAIGAGFTAAGWVWRTSGGTHYFVGKYSTSNREWMMFSNGSNILSARFSNDGTTQTTVASALSIAALNTWHFVALRYDAGTAGAEMTVCLNGLPKFNAAHSGGVFNGSGNVRLGASDFALASSTDGRLDSWGFWNRALSDAEIAELYNGGAGRIYATLPAGHLAGLIAWYDLAEASGARNNRHQNNHHAMPTGTPATAAGLVSDDASDEDPITTWLDQAGFLVQATQATAAARPTAENSALAHPAVSFDGTDDELSIGAPFTAASGYCLAWVSNPGAAHGAILGNSASAGMQVRQASATQTVAGDGSATITFTHASQSGPAVHILNGDASEATHYLDGGSASGSSGGGLGALQFDRIGVRGGGTPDFLQGDLGHLILCDAKQEVSAINRLGRYLAGLYGLTWTNVA